MSHLAKVVLEEQGYEVELLNADVAPSSRRFRVGKRMCLWMPGCL